MWEVFATLDGNGLGSWLGGAPASSYQLMLAAGALLVVAAVLLWFSRRTRITLDSSAVSEELMAYLARIAEAVERPAPQAPNIDDITREVLLRLEQIADSKQPNGKAKPMPQSMLREYRTEG